MSNQNKKPTFLSLFSGCGGFDQGFEDSGYECLGAFDNDPAVLKVYKKNLRGKTYLHDLSNHNLSVDYSTSDVDVLVSGSPCQGFSTAGLRNIDDPRNRLLLVSGEIAKAIKPKVIVCENVMGSISGPHKMFWDKLVDTLTGLNYKINFVNCCAADFGLAQLRKRVFLIAWKTDMNPNIKFDTTPKINLREALRNIEGVKNQESFIPVPDSNTFEIIKKIKPGQKLSNVRGGSSSVHTWDIPEVFGYATNDEKDVLKLLKVLRRKIRVRSFGDADPISLECIQENYPKPVEGILTSLLEKGFVRKIDERFDIKHTYNGLYKRLEWDKCSMTVDTRFGNPRYFLHPEEHRGFTVREAARIQGFKDSFEFEGTISQQFKMIGNAVPPPIAYKIANFIKNEVL